MMHVLRLLRRRDSEMNIENEPASADLASDDDEAFDFGFDDAERNERENSDPRECNMT
jgi:DDB1- and CUL4-associated factor 8